MIVIDYCYFEMGCEQIYLICMIVEECWCDVFFILVIGMKIKFYFLESQFVWLVGFVIELFLVLGLLLYFYVGEVCERIYSGKFVSENLFNLCGLVFV